MQSYRFAAIGQLKIPLSVHPGRRKQRQIKLLKWKSAAAQRRCTIHRCLCSSWRFFVAYQIACPSNCQAELYTNVFCLTSLLFYSYYGGMLVT